jgi:hypothetical protein
VRNSKNALISHMADNGAADGFLDRKILALKRKAEGDDITEYARTNCGLCVDAIEFFQAYEDNLDAGKAKFFMPMFRYPRLKISDVGISVSIDLETQKVDSKGIKSVGGAMFVFSKPSTKDKSLPDRCKAVTLLIQELLKGYVGSDEQLEPTLCMAIDVFMGKFTERQVPKGCFTKLW